MTVDTKVKTHTCPSTCRYLLSNNTSTDAYCDAYLGEELSAIEGITDKYHKCKSCIEEDSIPSFADREKLRLLESIESKLLSMSDTLEQISCKL